MAGTPELVGLAPPRGEEAEGAPADPREDFRVRCTSKRALAETLELCGRLVQQLGAALPEEVRALVLQDLQWTFESAVQENVSINGQAWQEASDNCLLDSDIKLLEDQFDESIVDVATKRKQCPRKILEHVIKAIKAKQEILKQYHPVVHPQDLKSHTDPAPRVEDLKCRGKVIAEEISVALKSLPATIEQGEGFSQVLKMQPVIHLQRVHQEVFSGCGEKPDIRPESFATRVEITPPENSARKASEMVLKRKHSGDCPQRDFYPLRPRRINLDS